MLGDDNTEVAIMVRKYGTSDADIRTISRTNVDMYIRKLIMMRHKWGKDA